MSIKTALQFFTSTTTLFILAGVFFVAGVTARVVFAGWVDPPDAPPPPAGGTAPINVANVDQVKTGGLYIGADLDRGILRVGVNYPDNDSDSRIKVGALGSNYGISVIGADQRGLFIDGQSTTNFGIYVTGTQGWGTYSASNPTSVAGGVFGTGGTYGVFGEGAEGDLIGDTYAVYGKGARALDGTSRYGVYGIAGEIGPTINSPAKTYGVYAATYAGDVYKDTYALYVNDQSTGGPGNAYAAYIKGRSRITDGSRFGGVLENTLDIYTNTGKSGLYVEQGNVSPASTAISASGGETAVYALGMSAGFNNTTYGVRVQAGNALNNSKSYGVYAKAAYSTISGSSSYALYGDTGISVSGGNVYGLYVVNNATDGERRTAFFEDANNINESSVEISSKSAAYGLKVVGGKEAVIYAEPRGRTGDAVSDFKAIYGKGDSVGSGGKQYAVYGEGGYANRGTTYGVYGLAGGQQGDNPGNSYGVYGDAANVGSYGVYARSAGGSVAFGAENEDHGFGYAAKFSGLVDLGPDGVFADGVTFLNDYVFAATYNGALSVGTLSPQAKLTVEGDGQFQSGISARELWLTDQNGVGETRYKLTVRDTNSDDPQLCIDIPTATCRDEPRVCTSHGIVSFRATDSTECTDKCDVSDGDGIDPETVTCRWNCSGKIGYDDCGLGPFDETSGFESCLDPVRATFELDAQAPAPNCFCEFQNTESGEGDIKEYIQKVYIGGYDRQCVDLAVAPK